MGSFPQCPRYQFMQLMEPLGAADGSVEALWDYGKDDWEEAFMEASRELAPTMIRWPGGCYASYYHWREGVGPADRRPLTHNILWGGRETNRVGTKELVDYCRRINAEPLIGINFESDGRERWASYNGTNRRGTVEDAKAWIDYCNNPDNAERRANGDKAPFDVRFWQIGNETSYDPNGFDVETEAAKTKVFAKEMRSVDSTLRLIAWGCSGWAPRMVEVAGDDVDYIAFHHHFGSGIPVARVMSMYRARGTHELSAKTSSTDLDVTAGISGKKLFLDVVLEPMFEFNKLNQAETRPVERPVANPAEPLRFPAGSVTVVELTIG